MNDTLILLLITFDSGCVGFCAGMALAAHGCLHLSETGLSGQGQEGKN